MKNQTQQPAKKKTGRKSETLTLYPEDSLVLRLVVERFHNDEQAIGIKPRDAQGMKQLHRQIGCRLIELAGEAVLDKAGSILHGKAWWKFVLTQMSPEDVAAKDAMIHAQYEARHGSLQPIDDATEAAAIQKLQEGNPPDGK